MKEEFVTEISNPKHIALSQRKRLSVLILTGLLLALMAAFVSMPRELRHFKLPRASAPAWRPMY